MKSVNGITELWYEDYNVPGRTIEEEAPEDYEPRQLLQISEFQSWTEVAQWAEAFFDARPASFKFDAEVRQLRAIPDPEQRVTAALQFVHDQIRYLRVAERFGARALTPPDEVLQRGFADKTDKALLALCLLRSSDIDAAPALVSCSLRKEIRQTPATSRNGMSSHGSGRLAKPKIAIRSPCSLRKSIPPWAILFPRGAPILFGWNIPTP